MQWFSAGLVNMQIPLEYGEMPGSIQQNRA